MSTNDFNVKYKSIIEKYADILINKMIESGWYAVLEVKPLEGDETNDIHLLWMLHELTNNTEQSETKKHRWLGYVQGVMTAKGYITVLEEREFTRSILNGA